MRQHCLRLNIRDLPTYEEISPAEDRLPTYKMIEGGLLNQLMSDFNLSTFLSEIWRNDIEEEID